ncbi:MAG: sulfite exporter TauE/SafE family protein [Prolixibacteraceae bacterium]|jgi:uncharacterized membrane protein YfcA|nr:sulfite exporter TauE/SafE family protein [Prolixibacteraceae bacterium]
MTGIDYIILIAAGIASGFINVVAGGGSLITLPVMIFLGLPPTVANASNRVALMAQNVVSVSNFKRKKVSPGSFGIYLGISALFGAIIGAQLAVDIPEELFSRILSIVMVIVAVLIVLSPSINSDQLERITGKYRIFGIIAFFFIGIYGGFLHAGVGFIMILSLVKINRLSLVKTNSIKVLVALIYTAAALVVFIFQDVINWQAGLVLGIGSATGGWLGSTFSVKKGDVWIKRILLVAILLMAVKLWFF